jgi:hypothetical protein
VCVCVCRVQGGTASHSMAFAVEQATDGPPGIVSRHDWFGVERFRVEGLWLRVSDLGFRVEG